MGRLIKHDGAHHFSHANAVHLPAEHTSVDGHDSGRGVGAATAAGWISNSNLSKRLDDIIERLERIEYKLDNRHERIAKLEERTSLLRT